MEEYRIERAKVMKEEIIKDDTKFLALYIEAKNSCLAMLSEKEDKLGTLALAVPNPKGLLGPVTSQTLLGDKHSISARMLAEYIVSKKRKITIVSVHLDRINELEGEKIFLKLIERIFQKNQKEEIKN